MKKQAKTEDQKKKAGYRTPSDFRRKLKYKRKETKKTFPAKTTQHAQPHFQRKSFGGRR